MPRVVKQEGDDPDPTPYLFVSLEQKRIDQTKPYDAKKACWVPDEADGFVQGEIRGTKGDLVTVALPSGDVSKDSNNNRSRGKAIHSGRFSRTQHGHSVARNNVQFVYYYIVVIPPRLYAYFLRILSKTC